MQMRLRRGVLQQSLTSLQECSVPWNSVSFTNFARVLNRIKCMQAAQELTVLELNDLVKACEEEFGVSAAAGVVVTAPGAGAAAAEEKDEFDVELTEVGPNKVKVIKVVREVTGLGLKEAKEVVDGAPKVIKEAASKAEAEEIQAKLEAEGARLLLSNLSNHRTLQNRVGIFLSGSFHVKINAKIICNYGKK